MLDRFGRFYRGQAQRDCGGKRSSFQDYKTTRTVIFQISHDNTADIVVTFLFIVNKRRVKRNLYVYIWRERERQRDKRRKMIRLLLWVFENRRRIMATGKLDVTWLQRRGTFGNAHWKRLDWRWIPVTYSRPFSRSSEKLRSSVFANKWTRADGHANTCAHMHV